MNPNYAADITFDANEEFTHIQRRSDDAHIFLPADATAKELGKAAAEAIDTKRKNDLPWVHEWQSFDAGDLPSIVVVSHENNSTKVLTPIYSWGQPDPIELKKRAGHEELGNAILRMKKYSDEMRENFT